jgi:uncharacterized membrane protein YphA (DoxX/SURF4 family)
MSRYYPGFLGALFIVLLRVVIGWHFLYEGLEKVNATESGKEPFSAEIYLRNATGPLAPYFRDMVPDADGRAMLDPDRLKAAWKDDVTRLVVHFGFTDAQQSQAQKILEHADRWADYWFDDPENAEKRQKYLHDLRRVEQTEENPEALSYEKERGWDGRRSLEGDRRKLTGPLVEREGALRDAIAALATADQKRASAAGGAPRSSLDLVNKLTMYGLIAIGFCLMAGFLTPVAAISAAVFLAMIYLSMPPWPGLPPNPKAEGHYLIVSKNLIELIACLVIATTPSGHWVGFDALFFGARRRRRELAARERGQESAHDSQRQPVHTR